MPTPRRRRGWLGWVLAALVAILALLALSLSLIGLPPTSLWALAQERAPMAWVRYAERRLEGHPKLEALAQPLLAGMRQHLEREPPSGLPDLGKGQRATSLGPLRYDSAGRPLPLASAAAAPRAPLADRVLTSVDEIVQALEQARAGQVLEVAPGSYRLTRTLTLGAAGTAASPITLRARQPGSVIFTVAATQAVVVGQPYWVFENLDWRGACTHDADCEHAYHVVGPARGTVILNNRMSDFNAQVKVNGERGQFPDDGLLQFNTLVNSRARNTDNPVVPFDLVAASGWQVLDNRVENFVKTQSETATYGLFMKGAGSNGRIERNLVVCTPQGISRPGVRVGISIGNGGASPDVCRDRQCAQEHTRAIVANNVVAHCNDAGIDVAKSRQTQVLHNTLVNTQGLVVRNPPSDALAAGNLFEGGLRARSGTELVERDNVTLPGRLQEPDALDLRWRDTPTLLPRHPGAPLDFCGRPRGDSTPPGAMQSASC